MSYTLYAAESVWTYNGTYYNVLELIVKSDDSKFVERAQPFTLEVTDGVTVVSNFQSNLSENFKQVHARFATDAFTALGATVDVALKLGEKVVHTFSGVNLAGITQAAPPWITVFAYPDADNAWLATL